MRPLSRSNVSSHDDLGAYGSAGINALFGLLDQIPGLAISAITGVSGQVVIRHANATVSLSDVSITSSGSVNIVSSASSDASLHTVSVSGIGVAFFVVVPTSTTEAVIEGGARVYAGAGGLTVSADTNIFEFAFSLAGSKASSFAISGAFSVAVYTNTTKVYIDSGALIESDGEITISATDDLVRISITRGFVLAGMGPKKTRRIHISTVDISTTTRVVLEISCRRQRVIPVYMEAGWLSCLGAGTLSRVCAEGTQLLTRIRRLVRGDKGECGECTACGPPYAGAA